MDEYLEEKKAAQNFRLQEQRKANEGSDDSQWKGTVPLQKEEDVFFVGKVIFAVYFLLTCLMHGSEHLLSLHPTGI